MHPAANPVQKGRNLLNASAQINEGTATIGCIDIQYKMNKVLRNHEIENQFIVKNLNSNESV